MDKTEVFIFSLPYLMIISAIIFICVLICKRKKLKRSISVLLIILTVFNFGLGGYFTVMQWLPVYYSHKYSLNLDEYDLHDYYIVREHGFSMKQIEDDRQNIYEFSKINNLSPGDWLLYGFPPSWFFDTTSDLQLYRHKNCTEEPVFDWEIDELTISLPYYKYRSNDKNDISLLVNLLKTKETIFEIEPLSLSNSIKATFNKTDGFYFNSYIYMYEDLYYIKFKDKYYHIQGELLEIIKPYMDKK